MRFNRLPPTVKTAEDLLFDFEQTGDPSSFEEIVRRYSGMVYGVCYRVTRNAHDAEDSTQAVFLKLALQARTENGVPRVGPWLQQVAKTTAVDLRRSRTRRQNREQVRAALSEQQLPGDSDASDALGMDELKQLLRDEVDQLPTHYRTPLILYYFGGLSTDQIAKELNCNAKALAVRLFRGRKMLGSRLQDRGILTAAGGAVVTLALADAILSALADAVWHVPGNVSTGGASAWLTSHTALMATISGRVASLTRTCALAAGAGKWKLSVVILLTMGSAMAGSSDTIRRSAAIRKMQDAVGGIRSLLRGWGNMRDLLQRSPQLQAQAEPKNEIAEVHTELTKVPAYGAGKPAPWNAPAMSAPAVGNTVAGVLRDQSARQSVGPVNAWHRRSDGAGDITKTASQSNRSATRDTLAMLGAAGTRSASRGNFASQEHPLFASASSDHANLFTGPLRLMSGPNGLANTAALNDGLGVALATQPDAAATINPGASALALADTGNPVGPNMFAGPGSRTTLQVGGPGSLGEINTWPNGPGFEFTEPPVLGTSPIPAATQPSPIPEPAAASLLAVGTLGLLARRRRK